MDTADNTDSRIQQRQEDILGHAAVVFGTYGYRETDVQFIADRAGVGKGTVYRYFPTKQKLFFAAVDRVMRLLHARLFQRAHAVEDPVERVKSSIHEYLAFFDEHREYVELLMLERAECKSREKPTYFRYQEESLEYWRKTLEEMMATGRIRQVPVGRILDVMSDLLYGVIFTNLFSAREKSYEEQARDIIDIVFLGFLSETERAKQAATDVE